MELFSVASVASITVIAYLVGEFARALPLDNKWIPIICGIVGGALGVVGLRTIADFPASDIVTAIAVGIVSGLAATGADQIIKQMTGK